MRLSQEYKQLTFIGAFYRPFPVISDFTNYKLLLQIPFYAAMGQVLVATLYYRFGKQGLDRLLKTLFLNIHESNITLNLHDIRTVAEV